MSTTIIRPVRSRNRRCIESLWGDHCGDTVVAGHSRKVTSKTERCSWWVSAINPHWSPETFPPAFDGETNGQREERLLALAKAAGGQYEWGIITVTGRAANGEDAKAKIVSAAEKLGITLVLEA